ncbi:Sterol regulatory element-binding protein 1 [Smittium culicis]|uniref:Sterol regulatory element-binding protein 1 n=1 Tax=Smittium culicis TaxID=133412 RepID=A0A1R1WXK9_9FUNG|nr:Sterol regulatory element-binding protein 1 [Smittium culicis]
MDRSLDSNSKDSQPNNSVPLSSYLQTLDDLDFLNDFDSFLSNSFPKEPIDFNRNNISPFQPDIPYSNKSQPSNTDFSQKLPSNNPSKAALLDQNHSGSLVNNTNNLSNDFSFPESIQGFNNRPQSQFTQNPSNPLPSSRNHSLPLDTYPNPNPISQIQTPIESHTIDPFFQKKISSDVYSNSAYKNSYNNHNASLKGQFKFINPVNMDLADYFSVDLAKKIEKKVMNHIDQSPASKRLNVDSSAFNPDSLLNLDASITHNDNPNTNSAHSFPQQTQIFFSNQLPQYPQNPQSKISFPQNEIQSKSLQFPNKNNSKIDFLNKNPGSRNPPDYSSIINSFHSIGQNINAFRNSDDNPINDPVQFNSFLDYLDINEYSNNVETDIQPFKSDLNYLNYNAFTPQINQITSVDPPNNASNLSTPSQESFNNLISPAPTASPKKSEASNVKRKSISLSNNHSTVPIDTTMVSSKSINLPASSNPTQTSDDQLNPLKRKKLKKISKPPEKSLAPTMSIKPKTKKNLPISSQLPEPSKKIISTSAKNVTASAQKQTNKPVRRKVAHNEIEKRYRSNINNRIHDLKNAVPALARAKTDSPNKIICSNSNVDDLNSADQFSSLNPITNDSTNLNTNPALNLHEEIKIGAITKLNKATILTKATEYIYKLRISNYRLKKHVQLLANEIASLPNGNSNLEKILLLLEDEIQNNPPNFQVPENFNSKSRKNSISSKSSDSSAPNSDSELFSPNISSTSSSTFLPQNQLVSNANKFASSSVEPSNSHNLNLSFNFVSPKSFSASPKYSSRNIPNRPRDYSHISSGSED